MGFLEGLKAADGALSLILQITKTLVPASPEWVKYAQIGLGMGASIARAVIANTENPGRYDNMTPEEIVTLLGFPADWDAIEAEAKARLA
jgi:hypothetical protein